MAEELDARMAELLRSSTQLDIDTRTFIIMYVAGLTALLLATWVFTGSYFAMIVALWFAIWNIREIRRVNDLEDRLAVCDFTEVMSLAAQHVIRWTYAVTAHVEARAALPATPDGGSRG